MLIKQIVSGIIESLYEIIKDLFSKKKTNETLSIEIKKSMDR
jgi:hypothetical protein